MRVDTPEFALKKFELVQEPIFVVEISFDLANTDQYYATTHEVVDIAGAVSQRSLKMVSGSSQKLNPSKANSTIGGLKFELLDFGSTEIFRTKLTENKGLRGKRVRVWKGFKGFLWSQFRLINTFIISDEISYKSGVYSFTCSDVQRSMKNKIFIETTTAIMAPLAADANEIEILDTSKFNLVYQVPSAGGKTLLRGMQQRTYPPGHELAGQLMYPQLTGVDKIGLIRIPGEDKDEIAIWTGKTTTKLTGLVRGVFGTTPVAVEVESGITVEDAPKITEYVYIDMPAVKASYALLTGSIYDAPGEFLPDHWHLGIGTDYIQTSSFIDIGEDLWDLTDDDKGFPIVIRGTKEVDAKKYIEEKIFYMLGIYAPINADGELALKRMQYIGPNGSHARLLDEMNVISHTGIKYNLKEVLNAFILKWNWDEQKEKFTRTSAMYDPASIERYGASDVKIIELETLHGSRNSDANIRKHFNSLRSRYAGPPIQLSVTLTPDEDGIEVGDIVRLKLKAQEDFTNEAGTLDRNYEVQQVSTDFSSGRVTLNLFGSSQRASDIVPDSTESVSDAFLTSEGTEINESNFPGAVSSDGVTTTVTGNITLNGNLNIKDPSAVYFCQEDLVIAATANVTINLNIQLRVKGFLEINGLINGKGNGLSGGVADTVISHYTTDPVASNLGKKGIGTTIAQDGTKQSTQYGILRPVNRVGGVTAGNTPSLNEPFLKFADGSLQGLPRSLLGTSGSSGGGLFYSNGNHVITSFIGKGGDGGDGGAGLAVFSKGSKFGAVGKIDLSGGDGLPGVAGSSGMNIVPSAGGGAGGAPGGLIIVTLDSAQQFIDKDPAKIIQKYGLCPKSGRVIRGWEFYNGSSTPVSFDYYNPGYSNPDDETNAWESNTHIVFLDGKSTPVADLPPYVEAIPTFTLTEKLNTPVTPEGNRSTIEVSVTRPIFGPGEQDNYSYSMVDYRVLGESLWISAKPASHESVIEVPSTGDTYEVRIRSVSKSNNVNESGQVKTITVTDVEGRDDTALSSIYPFDAITDIAIKGQAGTVFTGLDAEFEWNDSNSAFAYFNYYEVKILSGATVLRTEKTASPFYTYSYLKNSQDYLRLNAVKSVYNDLKIQVKPVSKYLNIDSEYYSGAAGSFTVSSSLVDDRENLRFYQQYEQQLIDDLAAALQLSGSQVALYQDDPPTSPETGDIWFETDNDDAAFRFDGDSWEPADDLALVIAIRAAQTAQTTADGKAYVFYQDATPTDPVPTEGDLWYHPTNKNLKRLTSGIWEIAGTNGATWGGDIDGQPSDGELLNNRTENNVTLIPKPEGATRKSGANQSGAIVINLPQGYTSTMLRMMIDVYLYAQGMSFTLGVGGYNYATTTQWINTFAQITGSTSANNRVRFGINPAGKCCIVIGEEASVWQYPQIVVKDFQAGFSNYTINQWKDGWSIDFVADVSAYTFDVDYADTLIDAKGIVGQGALATADVVDWATHVDGIPANLASLTGTESINNQVITINADGTLGGAGGGQVTPGGIGAETPGGAQAKADAAEVASKSYADANFALQTTLSDEINDLQNQIDGNITSWFYDGVPTLANSPASTWTDNATKDIHLGDLYYDNTTQYAYRFKKVSSVYSWERLTDADITAALGLASDAQDTADSKRRVFVVTPSGPYDIGDLWATGTAVKRATANRASGYLAGEWVEIANYTTSTSQLTDDAGLGESANWTGLNGVPSRFADNPSTGINLTAQYLGYYDGVAWQSYMDNQGRFYLNGDANNNLSWNGTALTVRGDIKATSVSAGAIDGITITGSTIQTASGAVERVVLNSSTNTFEAWWDAGSGTVSQHVLLGASSATSGQFSALLIGNSDYAGNGVRVFSAGDSRTGFFADMDGQSATGISLNCSGLYSTGMYAQGHKYGSYSYASSGIGSSSLGGIVGSYSQGDVGFKAKHSDGYANFKGIEIVLLHRDTVDTFLGTKADAIGHMVVIHPTGSMGLVAQIDNQFLLRASLATGTGQTSWIGPISKITDPMTAPESVWYTNPYNLLYPFFSTGKTAYGLDLSDFYICHVAIAGIATVVVSITSGTIAVGDRVQTKAGTTGDVIKTTTYGAHVIGRALAPATVEGQKIPIMMGAI